MIITSITAIAVAVTAGIGGLRVRKKNKRKRRSERIATLAQRMEAALSGLGLDVAWYPDGQAPDMARTAHMGQLQLFRRFTSCSCNHCRVRDVLELHYVIAGPTCGVERLFIGDCCDACHRFVAAPESHRELLAARSEPWLTYLLATMHIDDLIEILESKAAGPDVAKLMAQESELVACLNEVRLRLRATREAAGELEDGPYRPRLVEKTGT